MKSRMMRVVEHVPYIQEGRKIHKTFSQKTYLKARNHLGGLGTYGRMILKWNLKSQDIRVQTGFIGPRIQTSDMLLSSWE
jgi:hypothetical protein